MSESNIVLPTLTSGQVMILWLVLVSALVALAYGVVLIRVVLAADPGPKSMTEVADAIELGAMAYLGRQVKTMVWFVAAIFVALFFMYRKVYQGPEPAARHLDRLSDGRRRFLRRRLRRDVAGGQGQRPQRQRRADQLQGRDGTRVQGGRGLGDVHGRPGVARRDDHLPGVPRKRDEGSGRLRLRRFAGGAVHARRRRNLHQGG